MASLGFANRAVIGSIGIRVPYKAIANVAADAIANADPIADADADASAVAVEM
jgi:hypothetical protein